MTSLRPLSSKVADPGLEPKFFERLWNLPASGKVDEPPGLAFVDVRGAFGGRMLAGLETFHWNVKMNGPESKPGETILRFRLKQ